MNKFIPLFLLAALVFAGSTSLKAQKKISEEDKKFIMDIFSDVDPSLYRLEFNDGKEVYGKKRIKMKDLIMEDRFSKYANKSVKWTVIVGDRSANEVIYIYSEGMSAMASLLGKRKMEALLEVASRYPDVNPRMER